MSETSTPADHSPIPLRKNRAYQGIFWSQTCTDFAEQFLIVSITWAALHEFGGGRLGLVLAAWAIPRGVFMLFGGVLVDRWDRRTLAASVGAALAVLSAVAAGLTQSGNLSAWIGVAVCLGVLDAVRLPVAASVLPMVVAEKQIVDANRWSNLREWGALAGGPAVGGVLVALAGPVGTLMITAGMYVVSCLLMALVPALPSRFPEERKHVFADLADGLSYVVRHRRLRVLLPTFAVANLFILGLLGVAIPVFAKEVLEAGPEGLGSLSASFGAGMVLGTLLCTRLPKAWQNSQVVLFVLFAVSDAFLAAVGLAPNIIVACVAYFVSGVVAGPASTFYRAVMQTIPPEQYLGRVNSIARATSFGLEPVSMAAVGGLSARVSASVLLTVGGLVAAVADLVGSVLSKRVTVHADGIVPVPDARQERERSDL
ncbi:MFS transporter [Streptomyces sp. NBC_01231]|nr:MFS transporter [Streptomyces sp. NBC_01231]